MIELHIWKRKDRPIKIRDGNIMHASVGQAFCGVGFDKIVIHGLDFEENTGRWFNECVLVRLNP